MLSFGYGERIDKQAFFTSQDGVGIGGDYPLSAVIASEFSSTRIRGRMMTAVFANQGWGQCSTSDSWVQLSGELMYP
jgi:MFS family permease